ncbi:hemicentin-2-like isoform X2 [Asterias amurensis]|uniref:hemicentin-2-like isoform X2 n=1 Tax=Asterias amurensis TaxID=7602 RepID=UPI003AB791B1
MQEVSDMSRYRCRCWSPCRHVYLTLALLINLLFAETSSLQFTIEPGNHVAVRGQPTWWPCSAHSDQAVTYTWLRGNQPVNGQPNFEVLSNGTLHIVNVGQLEVGSYLCRAQTGGVIITSREVVLSLAILQSIFLTSPQSQSENIGSSVSLSCSIVSNPQASISWLFNGGDVTDDATSVSITTVDSATRSTLSIRTLEHKHGGQYRCLATNRLLPSSVVYSGIASLMLIGRPGFTSTPSPETVAVGGTVSFHCETTGSPPATIQWLNPNDIAIQSNSRFTSTQTTLRITNVQSADAGFYTCLATNEWGENRGSALLTVTQSTQQVVFTRVPVDQSVTVGGRVTLACSATGTPDPVISWSKIGGSIPLDRMESPSPGWLRITSIIATDSGVYICTASNGLQSATSQAQLIVLVPPSFTASPADTIARVGESTFFQCKSDGNPTPTITWTTPTTSTLLAPSGLHSGVEVSADGTLTVSPVERRHAGTYVCTATNSVSVISQSATLEVQSSPIITTFPIDQRIIEGSSTQISCRADANPSPAVTWLFNGVAISNDPKHSVYGNGDLTLMNIEKNQEGLYECQAQNFLGVEETSAFVVVLVPPDFDVYPTDQTIELGDSVRLDCVGTGDPLPVLQWLKEDQPLVLESNVAVLGNFSLMVNDITKANLGSYTCVATSEAGTKQISAHVWTPDIPFFSVPPTNTTANESMSATIPCQASARREPTIRWYLADDTGTQGDEVGLGTNPVGSRGARSFVAADGGLVFPSVLRSDEGLYVCVADNGIGSVEKVAKLLVNIPPEVISVTSPITVLDTATHVLLQCETTGRPTPSLAWFLPDGMLVPDDPSKYNSQPDNGYLVVYQPSIEEHDGDFSCVAENFLGNDSAVVTLIVQGAPILSHHLATRSDNAVTLQCLTKGSPAPTTRWIRDGQDVNSALAGHFIRSDDTLVIQDLGLAEQGVYVCLVENSYGSVSATFRVPDIPGTPQVNAITSTSVDLSWSPPTPNSNLTDIGYQLQYLRFTDSEYQDYLGNLGEPSVSVTGLVPYTDYTFRVRGVNQMGAGPFSLVTPLLLTAEGAPGEPRDLLVTPTGDVLIMRWTEPEAINGNPDNIVYQIAYTLRDDLSGGQEIVLTHDHNDLPFSVIIPTVRRNAEYLIRLRAGNTVLSEWSDYVSMSVMTLINAPVKSVTGLKAVAFGSSQVKVMWDPVNDTLLEHYNIAFRQLDSNMSYQTVQVTGITTSNFTIMGLRENTNYGVKMSYSNPGGDGPYTQEVLVTTELEPLSPVGFSNSGLSGGVLAAIICASIAIILLILILAVILWQRKHDPTSWIGRKRLNPDALWIHKSSGTSGQKGTYDVAIVNENYQADDTVMSTDSAYDLGSGQRSKGQTDEEEHKKKKKKKKKHRGWSDMIYRSPKNPEVVLVKKAVIGDFSPPPVLLANQTINEDQSIDNTDAPPKEKLFKAQSEVEEEDPISLALQSPNISAISDDFPPLPPAEFPVGAEFLTAEFPVFPNANDSMHLASELNIDSKQMKKMTRKTDREQRKKEKKDKKERDQEVGSRRRKLSDRISAKINPRKRGSMNFNAPSGVVAVENDYGVMTERQKENAAMF